MRSQCQSGRLEIRPRRVSPKMARPCQHNKSRCSPCLPKSFFPRWLSRRLHVASALRGRDVCLGALFFPPFRERLWLRACGQSMPTAFWRNAFLSKKKKQSFLLSNRLPLIWPVPFQATATRDGLYNQRSHRGGPGRTPPRRTRSRCPPLRRARQRR